MIWRSDRDLLLR